MERIILRLLTPVSLLTMNFKPPFFFYKSLQAPLMSTSLNIKAKCSQATLDKALILAQEIESQLSVYKEHSQLSYINQNAAKKAVKIDKKLYTLLETALQVSKDTAGLFDITVGALTQKSYKFGHALPTLPNRSTLKKALQHVSYENILLKEDAIFFTNIKTFLDLGGIGKGYAVDEIKTFLQTQGVTSALISLGGEIAAYGGRFKIGIAHPRAPKLYGYIEISGETYVSTSGDYERYIKNYNHNHIIDPKTGHSSSHYASLTLISKTSNATLLDAYNTAMFLMDEETLESFAKKNALAYLRLDKEIHETEKRVKELTLKYQQLNNFKQ